MKERSGRAGKAAACLFQAALLLLLICRGTLYFGESAWKHYKAAPLLDEMRGSVFVFLLLLTLIAGAARLFLAGRGKKERYRAFGSRRAAAFWWFIALCFSAVSFYEIEWINNFYLTSMDFRYQLLGILITFVLYAVLILLSGSMRTGLAAGSVLFLVWGMGNYFVQQFRGVPFQWIDLGSLRTAASVSGNYRIELTWPMVSCMVLTGNLLALLFSSGVRGLAVSFKGKLLTRAGGALVLLLFYLIIFKTDFLAGQGIWLRDWQPWFTYRLFGMESGFFAFAKASFPAAPDGYSEEAVASIIGQAEAAEKSGQAADAAMAPENIVVIMNESFADLSIYPCFRAGSSIMTTLNSLEEDTQGGRLLVSVKGGTTANTEYEFLTGNSCVLSPPTVVYNSFIKDDQYSLARFLKTQGYRTCAMHPYGPYGWNRSAVYPRMGFDEFLNTENSFAGAETLRGMVSDRGDYQQVIREIEEKKPGEKLFIFNVTMQNHSSYKDESFASTVKIPDFEGQNKGQAEQYATLIRISDEAVGELLDYFRELPQRTMVCFFGDHQPEIGDDFWEYCYGEDPEGLDFKDQQKQFMTRWFIWANYDIPEKKNLTISANYLGMYLLETAGLPLTGYGQWLMRQRETIPAMNSYGFFNEEGEAHEWGTGGEEEAEEQLLRYKSLIYNELTAGEKRDSSFFG